MDPSAVEKAQRRLAKAELCLTLIEGPQRSLASSMEPWTDFLLALSSIYSALEQGAKASPQSRQWFAGKKRERHDDPLLQYLHQARNADEHGIAPVTRLQPGGFTVTGDASAIESAEVSDDGLSYVFQRAEGKRWPRITVDGPKIRLASVTDTRFGDTFEPPSSHLGQPLADVSPFNVARLGVAYVRRLVDEAETIAQNTSVTTKSKG